MTDNEQYEALYTTAVSRVQALFAGAPTPGAVVRELERVGWRPMTPQELAAHRVTLVADSREALILWLDRYERANSSMPRKIGWHSDLADALFASGVVQVTTPTETDETPAESAMRDYAHALESNDSADGWGKEEVILDILRWADGYASRPAPVAPEQPTQASEDESGNQLRSGSLAEHHPFWSGRIWGTQSERRPRALRGVVVMSAVFDIFLLEN